ncbi:hypothetical protein Ciccas_009178 [Cichlidogyrus casuarinus]|uniref:Uncharacterized protein n=1 Tax=Cichlidogyrus casuarinus TaxID=1844966 RepID=A0ABD2PY01_9PLAT
MDKLSHRFSSGLELSNIDSEDLMLTLGEHSHSTDDTMDHPYSYTKSDLHAQMLMFCYGLTMGLVSASFYQFYALIRKSTKVGFHLFHLNCQLQNYAPCAFPAFRFIIQHVTSVLKSFHSLLCGHFKHTRANSHIISAYKQDRRLLTVREFSRTIVHFSNCSCFSLDFCFCLCDSCQRCNLRKFVRLKCLRSLVVDGGFLQQTQVLRQKALAIASATIYQERSYESGFLSTEETFHSDLSSNSSAYLTPKKPRKLVAAILPQTREHSSSTQLSGIFADCNMGILAQSTPNTLRNSCRCKSQITQLFDQAVQTSPVHRSFQLPEDENQVSSTSSVQHLRHEDNFFINSEDDYEYDEENQELLLDYQDEFDEGDVQTSQLHLDDEQAYPNGDELAETVCLKECGSAVSDFEEEDEAPPSPSPQKRLPKRAATTFVPNRSSEIIPPSNLPDIPHRMTRSAYIPGNTSST